MVENPFKKIEDPLKDAPKDLKDGVIQNINTVKLLMEMSSNFK